MNCVISEVQSGNPLCTSVITQFIYMSVHIEYFLKQSLWVNNC